MTVSTHFIINKDLVGMALLLPLLLVWHASDDVRIARVNDGQRAHPVVFATGCTELNVVSAVMMDSGFGQHSVVLNFRFPQSRTVVGQDYQLGFSLANHFLRLLVSENVFTALHHKLQSRVDGLQGLFL